MSAWPPSSTRPSPAARRRGAGLLPGDRIVSIGGRSIGTFEDISRYVSIRAGDAVTFDLIRAGAPKAMTATIGVDVERDRFGNEARIGRLGIEGGLPVATPVGRRDRSTGRRDPAGRRYRVGHGRNAGPGDQRAALTSRNWAGP